MTSARERNRRPVQTFSDEYLARCRNLSPTDIVRFLDDFKRIHGQVESRSRLISLKVPEPLLAAFKTRSRLHGVRYQTQIKNLMRQWLAESRLSDEGPGTASQGQSGERLGPRLKRSAEATPPGDVPR